VLPIGSIICWQDESPPLGWQVCDGTNGTPDLRGLFVPCAGGDYAVGDTGGSATYSLASHTHGAGTLTTYTPGGGHIHAGDMYTGYTTPGAGTLSSGSDGTAATATSHRHKVTGIEFNEGDGISSNHAHPIAGESGSIDSDDGDKLPAWVALYYIQRLS
jgi:hypothetical protein